MKCLSENCGKSFNVILYIYVKSRIVKGGESMRLDFFLFFGWELTDR